MQEADLVVAPLTITSDRERVVDFTTPFMEFGLSVMYQKIDRPMPDPMSFMEPLSNEIWMCISFAYLGVSVVLFLVSRLSPAEWGASLNKVKTIADPSAEGADSSEMAQGGDEYAKSSHYDAIFSIFNSFWFALSTFVQQGGDIVPRWVIIICDRYLVSTVYAIFGVLYLLFKRLNQANICIFSFALMWY